MKYIRTADGIYDTTKGLYTPSIKMFAIGTKTIYDTDIIKQSNTIEELCDLFYLDRGVDLDINDFYNKDELDIAKDYFMWDKDLELKAYIKSGDNIIYVAKMNKDGELELI